MEAFSLLDWPFWKTIGVAILCGGIIGMERQLRGKPAGVRTSILICLGTSIFIHLASGITAEGTDPTRVLGQLVTGVGFLGAGVMFANQGVVTGVTTAAVIWVKDDMAGLEFDFPLRQEIVDCLSRIYPHEDQHGDPSLLI